MRTSIFMQAIDGDPGKQYGWFAVSQSWRYGQIKMHGWEPVKGDEAESIFGPDIYHAMKTPEGYVSYRGLVLHSRPIELKHKEEYEQKLRTARRRQLSREQFLAELDRVPHLKAFAYQSLEEYADRRKFDVGDNPPHVYLDKDVPAAPDPVVAAQKNVARNPKPDAPAAPKVTPTPGSDLPNPDAPKKSTKTKKE